MYPASPSRWGLQDVKAPAMGFRGTGDLARGMASLEIVISWLNMQSLHIYLYTIFHIHLHRGTVGGSSAHFWALHNLTFKQTKKNDECSNNCPDLEEISPILTIQKTHANCLGRTIIQMPKAPDKHLVLGGWMPTCLQIC